MKHLYLLALAALLGACGNSKSTDTTTSTAIPDTPKLAPATFIESCLMSVPEWNANDIRRKELIDTIQSRLRVPADSVCPILADVPFQFKGCDHYWYGDYKDKWLVVFETGPSTSKVEFSPDYDLTFQVLARCDKDIAETLHEGENYYISGKYAGQPPGKNKPWFSMPNGRDITSSGVSIWSSGDQPFFNLGYIIIEDPTFTPQ